MILEKCIERLPVDDRKAFYEFKSHDRKEGLGPILDRMEMNGLAVVVASVDKKEKFRNSAVFKHVSRINHRCTPNATWDFDVVSFSMRIRALCAIENDEEIFISYIDDESVTGNERRAALRKYGITCGCGLCSKDI
ncbi:SET domain-containing protein 5 [Termitomyces sp. T112]|nr:SET domain-containing protein 5 [Termitomyces sp. T112]